MTSCDHLRIEVRCRTVAGGAKQHRNQCLDCGVPVGNAVPQVGTVPPFSEALFDAHHRFGPGSPAGIAAAAEREAKSAARDEWLRWYHEVYLLSNDWAQRRRLVLNRAHGICEGCLTAPATRVHHRPEAYRLLRETGAELLCNLVALCESCHDRVHHDKVDDQ